MCCFSRPVTSVAATRIFARIVAGRHQAVVYQMRLDAPEDLAMILPIPVVQPAAEDALNFVNLEKYKTFFEDVELGFPRPKGRNANGLHPLVDSKEETLKVHSVGSFDASFVPKVKDFDRVDNRFKLPAAVWLNLPQYADYGFAVFKLKKGNAEVHPMAFTFPTGDPTKLFFPTVHIHDGKVHPEEEFDHILYGQASSGAVVEGWTESPGLASSFVKIDKAAGLVNPEGHVYRRKMHGRLENKDVLAANKRMGL